MSKSSATFSKSVYELMSSMRFAISLLTVLAIASIIGTVLKQNEPYLNYIIQFGQYWFTVFEWLGLYDGIPYRLVCNHISFSGRIYEHLYLPKYA